MPLLQYLLDFGLFRRGRLNGEVPLEQAGDCGANTLFLLGVIGEEDAIALSVKQNTCWENQEGIEFMADYLFETYLFTDPSIEYETMECTVDELLQKVEELTEGYGTFLYMKDDETNLGHFTCIYKSTDGTIEIADLQTEENIKNDVYEPTRLRDYLNEYDMFYVPTMIDTSARESPARRAAATMESPARRASAESTRFDTPVRARPSAVGTPVRRSPSRPASEESPLKNSHGSPPKQLRPTKSPLSLEKKRSRVGGKRKKRKTRKHRRKN